MTHLNNRPRKTRDCRLLYELFKGLRVNLLAAELNSSYYLNLRLMKHLKKKFIFSGITVAAITYTIFSPAIYEKNSIAILTPKTAVPVVDPINKKLTRVSDLGRIVYALEKYKIKYKQYPISSNHGRGLDGLFSDYGLSKEDWIDGLAPEFIPSLPRDPRMLADGKTQYLYISNGAHYKLIAHLPDDCESIYKIYPKLVDPKRQCWAYGYWTPKAASW